MKRPTPADSKKPRGRKRFGRPRLLIVGCGDIGARILARVRDRFRVVATTTTPQRIAQLRALGAVPLVVNLDRRATLSRLRGVAARVVYLAPPPYGARDLRGRRLIAALGTQATRFVYVSTTGVYGDAQGAWLDETARCSPATERAMRRLDAEQQFRFALDASIVRAPGIYAADRLPLERLRERRPALIDHDDVYTNHIHADDLARIALAALFRGRPTRVYNAVDDSALKMGEFFELVAGASNLPRPPRLARDAVRAQLSPSQYSFMTESRRLRNTRIKRELKVRLEFPTVAAALAGRAAAT